MNILSVIPARGGSKGIPRKNVRLLNGKPLIAHTIEQALKTPSVNRVVISTDDAEIGAVSQKYGAEVVWRPAEISGDFASSEAALLHVLEYLEQNEGYCPDLTVFLQCTAPLTLAEDIESTIRALLREHADTALAVVPFHYFIWRENGTGDAVGINHDKKRRLLRQQREPEYLEAGAVYVMNTALFRETKHRFFGKTALYVMPADRRLEIDDPVDFRVAEVLLRERQQQERINMLPNSIAAVVFDFDGVFTDNGVIVFEDGTEAVVCNRGDGMGIAQLKRLGMPVLVLSTEKNPVVMRRCEKLGIECLHGLSDKAAALTNWASQQQIELSQVVYVGNDINDLACMQLVACSVIVNDAHPAVQSAARIVLDSDGGKGAVRETIDLITTKLETRTNAT